MDEQAKAGIHKGIAASKRAASIYVCMMVVYLGLAGYSFMNDRTALALLFFFTACMSLWVARLSRKTVRAMQKLV